MGETRERCLGLTTGALIAAVATLGLLALSSVTFAKAPDIDSVAADLVVPRMTQGEPAAGRRVQQTIPSYRGTAVHHALYLPFDWQRGRRYPVLVEYAGNGDYRNEYGDVSTGRVEDSKLGFGISAGRGCIWVCMPYLDGAGKKNVTKWWGDAPDYAAGPTLDYCKRAVPWICSEYGGDPKAVFLMGFSRGAIACNYLGLYDDGIARLWRGFVAYSHYDGVVTSWGYPGADRAAAVKRLRRLEGRPQFICHEVTADARASLSATKAYLEATKTKAPFTFMETGFRNHSDAWALRPSPARAALRKWLREVLRSSR